MPSDIIERLMDNARINAPGALDAALQLEMFNALDEFCRGANLWTEEIQIDATPAYTLYSVIPSMGQATYLEKVVNSDGIAVKAIMSEPEIVELETAPAMDMTLYATVFLTLIDPIKTDGYPELPEWILIRYYQAILDGMLGKLLSQPLKPYASERLAIYHLRRFRDAIAGANTDARHKNLYGAQRWQYPKNFA